MHDRRRHHRSPDKLSRRQALTLLGGSAAFTLFATRQLIIDGITYLTAKDLVKNKETLLAAFEQWLTGPIGSLLTANAEMLNVARIAFGEDQSAQRTLLNSIFAADVASTAHISADPYGDLDGTKAWGEIKWRGIVGSRPIADISVGNSIDPTEASVTAYNTIIERVLVNLQGRILSEGSIDDLMLTLAKEISLLIPNFQGSDRSFLGIAGYITTLFFHYQGGGMSLSPIDTSLTESQYYAQLAVSPTISSRQLSNLSGQVLFQGIHGLDIVAYWPILPAVMQLYSERFDETILHNSPLLDICNFMVQQGYLVTDAEGKYTWREFVNYDEMTLAIYRMTEFAIMNTSLASAYIRDPNTPEG